MLVEPVVEVLVVEVAADGRHLQVRGQQLCLLLDHCGFGQADVVRSEVELAIEVGLLNGVEVEDSYLLETGPREIL